VLGLLLVIELGCTHLTWCALLVVSLLCVIIVRVGFKMLFRIHGLFFIFLVVFTSVKETGVGCFMKSVLNNNSYYVLSKLQIGLGSFVCILYRGDYFSFVGM
jgi:hypothetical protein